MDERIENGYLLQYQDKGQLGKLFDALRSIADEQQTSMEILYQESMIQFLQVKFGNGQHYDDLESKLKGIEGVQHIEKDYLERKI